jgi:hypothetical protein
MRDYDPTHDRVGSVLLKKSDVVFGIAVGENKEPGDSVFGGAAEALSTRGDPLKGHLVGSPCLVTVWLNRCVVVLIGGGGPFASAEKAAKLCSRLKAAGGDCVILKN